MTVSAPTTPQPSVSVTAVELAASTAASAGAWQVYQGQSLEGEEVQKKTLLHTRQLLSRHEARLAMQSRLISVFARQLERLRELLPCWVEQYSAVGTVVSRKEQELAVARKEVKRLAVQVEEAKVTARKRHEALVAGLNEEIARAEVDVQEKQRQLDNLSLQEHQTRLNLNAEMKKNEALRKSMDKTVQQLSSLRTHVLDIQAERSGIQPYRKAQEQFNAMAPGERAEIDQEWQDLQRKRDLLAREKEQVTLEILHAQNEVDLRTSQSARLEAFLAKITASDPGGTPFLLSSAAKREALALLAICKRRAKEKEAQLAVGAPSAKSGVARRAGSVPASARGRSWQQDQLIMGRKCYACDYMDGTGMPEISTTAGGYAEA